MVKQSMQLSYHIMFQDQYCNSCVISNGASNFSPSIVSCALQQVLNIPHKGYTLKQPGGGPTIEKISLRPRFNIDLHFLTNEWLFI